MRVLVVEDHHDLAETLAVGLRREGLAVDVVGDGLAALERTAVNRYEVVVLDRDLPGLHGAQWNLIRRAPIAFVALCGHAKQSALCVTAIT